MRNRSARACGDFCDAEGVSISTVAVAGAAASGGVRGAGVSAGGPAVGAARGMAEEIAAEYAAGIAAGAAARGHPGCAWEFAGDVHDGENDLRGPEPDGEPARGDCARAGAGARGK